MEVGDVIAQRFQIERLGAVGGMGSVYLAIDQTSGSRVALKVMRDQGSGDTERFLRETRMLAELDHPNVVRYIAHGVTSLGAPFLVMEWLEGEDLASRLRATETRLVVMSACNGGLWRIVQPLMKARIPAVIGVNGGIYSQGPVVAG